MLARQVTIIALTLLFLPATAFAQAGLTGVVRDATGGVLPGVTVEASSPALIEQVRIAVADNQGVYRITNLRPGLYTVTFTLVGFSTVVREGVELAGTFMATVNAELVVGGIEETILVSGAAPVVDVQSVAVGNVITKDEITLLPTARTFQTLAVHTPGVMVWGVVRPSGQDVGGSAGDQSQLLSIHGGRPGDMQNTIDGMLMNNANTTAYTGIFLDMGAMEEVVYQLGAITADTTTGGVHANFIPKDGGNIFSGTTFGAFTNSSLQNDNTSDELRARGIRAANKLHKIWDINQTFGGPIVQDKLWFFGSARYWGLHEQAAGMFHDLNLDDYVYTPDLSRPAIDDSYLWSGSLRFTYQATPKNKLTLYLINQGRCLCHNGVSRNVTPDASRRSRSPIDQVVQGNWISTVSSRVLLEAGFLLHAFEQSIDPQKEYLENPRHSFIERSTGLTFRGNGWFRHDMWTDNFRAALSYVTGSHSVKTGFNVQLAQRDVRRNYFGDMQLELLNGVPNRVRVWNTPSFYTTNATELGIYVQDQWSIDRLTLNLGIRYQTHNGRVPVQNLPAVRFVPERNFAAISDVPNWRDLMPRLGLSMDVFGDGRTALKVSMSKYVAGEVLQFAQANNPVRTTVENARRTWNDLNGDFIAQEEELGPLSNASFGKTVIRTRSDDDIREGFNKRPYNWETAVGIQHEMRDAVSFSASYHRRWYGNFTVTDNLLVSPTDFDPFCITAPTDAKLPGGGGQQICGLFDISPAKYGQSDNLRTFADNFGTMTEVYNGVDLSGNARLPNGAILSGGINVGRTAFDNCDVIGKVDQPAGRARRGATGEMVGSPSKRFCRQDKPFLTQLKVLLGNVSLPGDISLSTTFQSLPGPEIRATYVAKSADIRGSLGRDLSQGARGTQVVDLIEPGLVHGDHVYQADVRVARIFQFGPTRLQANFDVYNIFNANPVLVENTRFGSAWRQPQFVLPGRLFKFSAQLDF